jgi:hypothetical protein
MGENRSQFLTRRLQIALDREQPTSDLVGKLYAAEMDRIGDEIDDGLGEGFKLGSLGVSRKPGSSDIKIVEPVKPNLRDFNDDDCSWTETFTKKSFDNCKQFFHEAVQAENVIGQDVRARIVVFGIGTLPSLYEVYLDVSFLKHEVEDMNKRPPGFVACEDKRRTKFDAVQQRKYIYHLAHKLGQGLEALYFEGWKLSIRRWAT